MRIFLNNTASVLSFITNSHKFFIQYTAPLVLWLALLGNIILFGISQDDGKDVWAHALHGRILVEERKCPRFSDYSCVIDQDLPRQLNYVSQILFYLLLKYMGYTGLLVLKVVVLVLICTCLVKVLKLLEVPGVLANASCLLFLVIGYHRFKPRGDFFCLLFLPLYIYILEHYRRSPGKVLWLLLPLQIMWINLHPLGILGIGIVAAYGLNCYCEKKYDRARVLIPFSLAVLAVSFIHPETHQMVLETLRLWHGLQTGRENFVLVVTEFLPLIQVESPWVIYPYFAIVTSTAMLLILNRKHGNWHHMLFFIVLALASWQYSRLVGIFAVYSAFLWPRLLWQWLARFATRWEGKRLTRRVPQVACGLLILLHLFIGISIVSQSFFKWNRDTIRCRLHLSNLLLPIQAVEFLKRYNFAGNVYTDYNSGGYVGFHLYPDVRIFMHSLGMTTYTNTHLRFYSNVCACKILPEIAISRYRIELFVLTHDGQCQPLTRWLYRHGQWRVLYLDESTAIFGHKDHPLTKKLLPHGALNWDEKTIDIPRIASSAANLANLAIFFMHIGELEFARSALLKALVLDDEEHNPIILNNLGNISTQEEQFAQALQFYVKSAEKAAHGKPPCQNIQQLFMKRKLIFDPNDPWHQRAMKLCPELQSIIED